MSKVIRRPKRVESITKSNVLTRVKHNSYTIKSVLLDVHIYNVCSSFAHRRESNFLHVSLKMNIFQIFMFLVEHLFVKF